MSLRCLARLAAPLVLVLTLNAATDVEIAQGFRSGAIIAKPKANLSAGQLDQAEKAKGISNSEVISPFSSTRLLHLAKDDTPAAAIKRLTDTGLYDYVEPDFIRRPSAVPNDPKFTDNSLWHLRNTGNNGGTAGADIDAVTAWDTRTDSSDVLVAVMDTGIRATHEDLKDNLWVNPKETAGNNIDDDGDGYTDDVYGANVIDGKTGAATGNVSDDNGHGTAVTSVIGAVGNNGKGMTGVAWKAKIMTIKWGDSEGMAFTSAGKRAIEYAIAKGAKIINMSYGGHYYSQTEYDSLKAARDAGVIIVAAAGNDDENLDVIPTFPASYRLDNIVVVAASGRTDKLTQFTNYGASVTDVAAPGIAITVADRTSDTAYKVTQGTSFSAPIIASSLALVKAQFPADDYRASINRILNSVDTEPDLEGWVANSGRVNLSKALKTTEASPYNDRFGSPSLIEGALLTARGSSKHATAETGAPAIAGVSTSPLLWWSWTAPSTGAAIVDLKGSDFDTVLGVFTGTAIGALTEVASNDNAPGAPSTSRVEFTAVKDTTYRIAVGGKANATGFVVATVGYVPGNNGFANATNLATSSVAGTNSNTLATRETSEPVLTAKQSGVTVDGATVWYKWTADRAYNVVSFNTSGNGIDTLVRAYRGSSVGALTEVANLANLDRQCYIQPTSGETYYFAVDSLNGRTGSFTFVFTDASLMVNLNSEVNGAAAYDHKNLNLVYGSESGVVEQLTLSPTKNTYKYVHGGLAYQGPAINAKGEIYVADVAGYLSKFDKNMSLLWEKKQEDTNYYATAAIAADGTVYVHSSENRVHAYRPDGTLRWTATLEKNEDDDAYSAVAIGSNGRLYVTSDMKLFCLDPLDGRVIWAFTADSTIFASVALGVTDTAYFPDATGNLYAVTSAGTLSWKKKFGNRSSSSPAIAANGDIIYGDSNNDVYAVTSAGVLKWTYSTDDSIWFSSPAIDAAGRTYIGSLDGLVHVISSTGTAVETFATGDKVYSSPLIGNQLLVYGSSDNYLSLHQPDVAPLTTTWSTLGANPRRTGRILSAAAPTFVVQPSSSAYVSGSKVTLAAQVTGADDMTFQWYKDGVAIAGATNSDFVIDSAAAGSAGSYTVKVTNSVGNVTSTPAVLTLATADNRGYLYNMSVLSTVQSDTQNLAFGFYLSGGPAGSTTPLLARAIGPGLNAVGVGMDAIVADPSMSLYSTNTNPGTLIETNDDWNTGDATLVATQARVGAYSVGGSTKDSILLRNFASGVPYSAELSPKTSKAKLAHIELYDASTVRTAASPRLTNASARNYVGGGNVLAAGFALKGGTPVKLLIRASGPALAALGLPGTLVDPSLDLRREDKTLVESNDEWASGTAASMNFGTVGAFGFPAGSKDAAILVTLPPGNYTATVGSKGNDAGIALLEIYEVP